MWCVCMCVTAACTIDLNQIDGWQGVGTSRAVAASGGICFFGFFRLGELLNPGGG